MSLRQIRKLQQSRKDVEPDLTPVSSSDDAPVSNRRPSAFALMRSSSSSSSSSSSDDGREGSALGGTANEAVLPVPNPVQTKPLKPGKIGRSKKKKNEEPKGRSIGSVLDPVLSLNPKMLNPANELKRIFGSQRVARSTTRRANRAVVITRRHWLIEPGDPSWPMVVKDVFKMEICSDGTHRLVPELDYENKLRILSRIIVTHDIDALYQFVQLNPFHPHGLIQLATILISERSEYETAYQLIRRCLFAIQSCFIPSFHPSKSVILSTDSIFSSCLLRSLLLYAHLLAGQGCSRTSLEVMKLIYAMEGGMSTGAPRTHVLLHMDTMAMRAGEYEWLSKFASYNGLTDSLPSTALLFALAQKRRGIEDGPKRPVTVPKSIGESMDATSALIRALCMFPQLSRVVYGTDLDCIPKKVDTFTNKLMQAFVTKGFPETIKVNDDWKVWIESVRKIINAGEFKVAASLNYLKPDWLTQGYTNITSAEFEWGKASKGSFVEPSSILESEAHVLEVYNEEGGFENEMSRMGSARDAPRLAHPVSLESNPLAAFFQTLLPWSSVDHSGTEATPITAGGLLEQLRERLGMNRVQSEFDEDPVIRDASDVASETSQSSSEDDEIEME